MATASQVSVIILAAGASSRFGGQKMLAPLPSSGHAVLATTIKTYQRVFARITVVTRPSDESVRELALKSGVDIIDSHHAESGMSQSIIAGIQARSPDVGWLVALGDMPFVSSETLKRLVEALTLETIVVPTTEKGAGNPVAFGKAFGQQLLSLKGDFGAKSILRAHQDKVIELALDDPGVHQDIDTPDDINRYRQRH